MLTNACDVIQHWVGDSERWLREFLDSLPPRREIISVVAIGSCVRNPGHRRSDFDLLVVYGGMRPLIDAPLEVDLRLYSAEKLDKQIENGNEIICWALKFGRTIYDPAVFWSEQCSKWELRIPLPSAEAARTRFESSLSRAEEMVKLGDDSAAEDMVLSAVTQLVRERLIHHEIFPASRPELAEQLRAAEMNNALSQLLDDAMYGDYTPSQLLGRLKQESK